MAKKSPKPPPSTMKGSAGAAFPRLALAPAACDRESRAGPLRPPARLLKPPNRPSQRSASRVGRPLSPFIRYC
jgi:hypothetical protein